MTRGMPPEAIQVIEHEQPYNVANRTSDVGPDSIEALYALNALQAADKHRNPALIVAGISHPRVRISWGDESVTIETLRYVAPGEELVRYDEIDNRIAFPTTRSRSRFVGLRRSL